MRLRAAWIACLLAGATVARAQSLPLRRWDVGDGLSHSRVNCVRQDARGFLWIGTWEGLSRFDGGRFTSYGTDDGLGTQVVNCIAEDAAGRLWIGTNGAGVARLIDDPGGSAGGSSFSLDAVGDGAASDNVNTITCDSGGKLWLVTDQGLYVRGPEPGARCELVERGEPWNLNSLRPACCDAGGTLWFGIGRTLLSDAGGDPRRHPLPADAPSAVAALHVDARGRLLAACRTRLYEIRAAASDADPVEWLPIELPLTPGQELRCLCNDRRGRLWLGTSKGLLLEEDGDWTTYTSAHGLPDEFVRTLSCDRDGNLWIGTNSAGLLCLGEESLVGWTRAQGLPEDNVVQVVEALDGTILATTWRSGVVRIVGGSARLLPEAGKDPLGRSGLRLAQDTRGLWWIATERGLFQAADPLPDLERARPFGDPASAHDAALVTGFPVYPDPTGRVWIGTTDGRLLRVTQEGALEELARDLPGPVSRMRLDAHGTLWIDARHAVGRWRGGRLELLSTTAGLPEVNARAFLEDSRGWMWVGLRSAGVSVCMDPGSERPTFRNYSTREGLASNTVWALAEDRQGRIYLGTGRGLDRIDPTSGVVRHLGNVDGLAGSQVNDLLLDRAGDLWIASSGGLSRLTPRADPATAQQQDVFLVTLEVGGVEVPLPRRGTRAFALAPLSAGTTPVRLGWVAPCFQGGAEPSFQYRLAGAGGGWSAPTRERGVSFASLGGASYRFEVRAVEADGSPQGDPAVLSFEVLPPVWQRGWFLALCLLGTGGVLYSLHRARVRRLLSLESLRHRIAADVHDDVGAGLAQIAILAEVARREPGRDAGEGLEEIARVARSLRESMSEIVWTIDPRRDTLGELVLRLRQTANNLFADQSASVDLRVPDEQLLARTALPPDARRHLLLAAKELLSNAARHGRASRVQLALELRARELLLQVEDDGRGFDPSLAHAGHGLHGLELRARAVRGSLVIESAPGRGTRASLRLPLSANA